MSFFRQPSEPTEGNAPFNDILATPALRMELVTIIALASDAMRRELQAVFQPLRRHNDQQPKKNDTINSLIDFEEPDAAIEEESREAERQEEADLQSVRTQGLRRAAVTYFDKWQIDVLRRLGEVLSVRPDAIRKARADAKAKAEAAAKARRDKAYWDWANGLDDRPQDDMNDPAGADSTVLPDGFQAKILRLPKDKRGLVLDSVLLLLLSLEQYAAHSRMLMLHLTRIFQLPESTLSENESKVAEGLLASAAARMSGDESTKRQASGDASARRWKVGLATVAGAALIGVTGGLAAPILAAGVGGIMGGLGLGAVASLLGPLATNMVLVGGLFGAYGGRMTGRIMEKYAQEIKDFKFLPVSSGQVESGAVAAEDEAGLAQLQDDDMRKAHKLRVVVGISGSVTEARDYVEPWTAFSKSKIEAFGLRWEMDALMQLGRKMAEVLRSFAWDFAKFQLLSMVLAGLWPFGLLRAAGALDSPFAIAKTRSDKAGKVLADALVNKVQGTRSVTLVGFGLGARIIYSCLLQLAEQNAFGLVESAVFMGAPTPSEAPSWRRIRAVVSGRVVNVFSADDFMLGFLYRANSVQMGIAGVQKVEGVAGIENYDFTDMIKGHDKYRLLVGTILQRVGFADVDNDIVRQQQEALRRVEEDERKAEEVARVGNADNDALAKQDEQGQIVLVDGKKAASSSQARSRTSPPDTSNAAGRKATVSSPTKTHQQFGNDEEDAGHTIQMEDNDDPLSIIEPEPEPDYGPDRETVRFGSGGRGFNIEWDYDRH